MQPNTQSTQYLFACTSACLQERDPQSKCGQVATLHAQWRAGRIAMEANPPPAVSEPGRPSRPLLVLPRAVPQRPVHTKAGRAALIHALAHIEFNAINLALDAVCRFPGLPREYYGDWLRVAAEEARHFTLLRDHLLVLGYGYGDFAAHDGLWEMALKTAHDPLHRMALVPRVLEARGLDASPAIIRKLERCGDAQAVQILEVIQREEIGHVAIGNRWYRHLCAERGLDPLTTFRQLLMQYGTLRLRRPFATRARQAAGFSEHELALLNELAS